MRPFVCSPPLDIRAVKRRCSCYWFGSFRSLALLRFTTSSRATPRLRQCATLRSLRPQAETLKASALGASMLEFFGTVSLHSAARAYTFHEKRAPNRQVSTPPSSVR